jgi:hypothetical protein
MDILTALRREERKIEKELGRLQNRLQGVRAAANALRDPEGLEFAMGKKRVMSAAGRARVGEASRARWARVRAEAAQAVA